MKNKFNKSNTLVLFMVFAVVIGISAMGSVSAADPGNATLNATNSSNSTGLADSPYPTSQVNNNRTGQSNYTGPETNTTKWQYNPGSGVTSSVIGSDGTIYVGTTGSATLAALNPNGTVKWTSTLPYNINGLSLGKGGILYVVTQYGLYAVNSADGTTIWNYTNGNALSNSPAIGSDGTIYIRDNVLGICAIRSNGTLKWNYTTYGTVIGFAIGADGTIYAPCGYVNSVTDNMFYAINPDGTLKWSLNVPTMQRIPVIGADGTIYVTSYNVLYAFKPDGNLKWTYNSTGTGFYTAPSIANDGTMYIQSSDGIYALTDNGNNATVKWNYASSSPVSGSSIAIGADGTIYTGGKGVVHALKPDGNLKWNYGGINYRSAMLGPNGTLYVINSKGPITAFQDLVGNFTATTSSNNLTVQFNDTSSNIPTFWDWDFGDGSAHGDQQNPSHTYSKPGNYTVVLTVATDGGASNTVSKTVSVTGDAIAPTVKSVDPASNATGVALNKTITVTFSEPVKVGNGYIELKNSNGTAVPFTKSIKGSVLTITPSVLVSGMKYSLILHTGCVTDMAGNSLAMYVSKFTTFVNDTVPPTVKSVDPASNATGVALNKTITVTFSEPVKVGNGYIELKNSNGTAVPFTKSIKGSVLTITPSVLVSGMKYSLILHTGCVTDMAGNSLAMYVSKFTTFVNDTVPPTVKSVDPASNATGVALNKTITVTFSEPVKVGNGYIELKNSNGTAVPFTKSIKGSVLTITPSVLVSGMKYSLILHTGCVTDMAGNSLAMYVSKFTTFVNDTVPPTVKSVDPASNATGVALNKTITVTFSEPVKVGNGYIELKNSNGTAVPFTKSIKGSVLTITPNSTLVQGMKYSLILHTGCVTDMAGNSLAMYVTKFTTNKT